MVTLKLSRTRHGLARHLATNRPNFSRPLKIERFGLLPTAFLKISRTRPGPIPSLATDRRHCLTQSRVIQIDLLPTGFLKPWRTLPSACATLGHKFPAMFNAIEDCLAWLVANQLQLYKQDNTLRYIARSLLRYNSEFRFSWRVA
jgi:hypothetical protein